jgi:hypothetical protein
VGEATRTELRILLAQSDRMQRGDSARRADFEKAAFDCGEERIGNRVPAPRTSYQQGVAVVDEGGNLIGRNNIDRSVPLFAYPVD